VETEEGGMIVKIAGPHSYEIRQPRAKLETNPLAANDIPILPPSELWRDGKLLGAVTRIEYVDGEKFIHYDSRGLKAS
jgi:Ser/Thr protein kinase RdoA (MazF antagonist)